MEQDLSSDRRPLYRSSNQILVTAWPEQPKTKYHGKYVGAHIQRGIARRDQSNHKRVRITQEEKCGPLDDVLGNRVRVHRYDPELEVPVGELDLSDVGKRSEVGCDLLQEIDRARGCGRWWIGDDDESTYYYAGGGFWVKVVV